MQLLLTAMPGVAATLLAARCGVRGVPTLLAIALVGSGAGAMLVFWVYYLVPALGGYASYALFFGSAVAACWCREALAGERELLRELATALALWAFGSLFVVFFGFLHGGTDQAITTATSRFSTGLASDAFIPWFYADWIFTGHPGSPPIFEPGWQFSDRPPLQVSYLVSQRVFGWDAATVHAELIGIVIQQFWIVALWALLAAARIGTRARALIAVAALLSDVAVVYSFFTWPKLLAASFVIAALALTIDRERPLFGSGPGRAALFGALCALAMLAHGTSFFGLVPVAIFALWGAGSGWTVPGWRWLGAALAVALALYLPWTAFQHFADPPGNRVVKWGLAGVAERNPDQGTLDAVTEAYGRAGVGGTLKNKARNFLAMVGGAAGRGGTSISPFSAHGSFGYSADAVEAVLDGRWRDAVRDARLSRETQLLWALGLLGLALPAIAIGVLRGRRRPGPLWDLARACGFVVGVGLVIWGLVMFGNTHGRAIVISGTLALPLLAAVGLVAGLLATYPRLAWALVAANAVTVLALFAPALDPLPGTTYSGFAALAALAALAGFVLTACGKSPRRMIRERPG